MRQLLEEVQLVLYDLADNAGDVPAWNEGGSLYNLSKRIKEALDNLPLATREQLERARNNYEGDGIQIPDDAVISRSEDGVWVMSWVYLDNTP